ncbi:MAG: hypothetical protein WDN69_34710 [Aliidongia sp.]
MKSTESILRGLLRPPWLRRAARGARCRAADPAKACRTALAIRYQPVLAGLPTGMVHRPVRASAEVLTAAPAEPADAHALEAVGGDLFAALHRHHRVIYDTALFDDLVQLVHGSQVPRFRPPRLRFGAAVSWRAGRAPMVSCAFDLFAGGQFGAEDRLRRVVARLQADRAWTDLARLLEDGEPLPPCRIVTVDFLPGGEHRARIDIMGAAYPLSRLRRLARACGGEAWAAQLDLFNEHVLGGLDRDRTTPGLQLRLGLGGQASELMLIAPLPGRYPDDFAASGAVAALAARLGIPLPGHDGSLQLLAPDTPLAGLQRLQHSCSLALGETPRARAAAPAARLPVRASLARLPAAAEAVDAGRTRRRVPQVDHGPPAAGYADRGGGRPGTAAGGRAWLRHRSRSHHGGTRLAGDRAGQYCCGALAAAATGAAREGAGGRRAVRRPAGSPVRSGR